MTKYPRVTFGLIVLNGEPFTRYNLRALYPFAHQIIVVEGASPYAKDVATPDGHSTDGTLDVLLNFKQNEDPDNKVLIVTAEDECYPNGFWPGDKDEQSQAYAKRATGEWLWQIDVDEFYQPSDMQLVLEFINDNQDITCLAFNAYHFWGGFDYLVTGGLFFSNSFQGEKSGAYRRLFRWGDGYQYLSHRPPTVVDNNGNLLDKKKINYSQLQKNARMYHYFMVFLPQVIRKGQYYDKIGWKHEDKVEERYARLFSRLTKKDYFHIFTHRGTHNWLEPFRGKHPPVVDILIDAIYTCEGPFNLRDSTDIEEMFALPSYHLWRTVFLLMESARSLIEGNISVIKKYVKGILRDTVGKPIRRSKIIAGGQHVSKGKTTLADARRNGADWQDVTERE